MDEKTIHRLIDACRPGSEDLADDAMEELNNELNTDAGIREIYQKTQANDDAIRTALHQVDVPDDLASRLMERLAPDLDRVRYNAPSNFEDDTEAQVMSQSTADGVNSHRGWSRRRWLATAALVSAAVIGGLLLVPGFVKPRMNAEELSNTALNWIDLLDDKTWNADLSAAPKHLPISRRLSARPNRWRIWQTPPPLNEKSIAYQLISPIAREKAVLFVTEHPNRIQNLTTTPPAEPLADTAGRASGVWREGDRLYVLVVPGGKLQYKRCLRRQHFAALRY
jgi:hypothetical protein